MSKNYIGEANLQFFIVDAVRQIMEEGGNSVAGTVNDSDGVISITIYHAHEAVEQAARSFLQVLPAGEVATEPGGAA